MIIITKLFAVLFIITLFTVSCGDPESVSTDDGITSSGNDMSDAKKRISYTLGVNIGNQFKRDNIDIDIKSFAMALADVGENRTLQLTPEELQTSMIEFQKNQRQRQEKSFNLVAKANKREGEAYMVENAKKADVVTTASGLQYKELVAGSGRKPSASDTVTVHYRGTLLDGTVFDSSYDRGEPASFPLSGVIPGWTEGLQLMPVGSKWELVIPSDLAYGPRGTGREIGPNATLKFEVELLEIN